MRLCSNNYDLRTAAARVEEARSQIGVARSFLYPQVNFNGGGSVQQVSRAERAAAVIRRRRTFQNWAAGLRYGLGDRCLRQDSA